MNTLGIRKHISKSENREAYITAWFTVLLAEHNLLFSKFSPQATSTKKSKKLSASEYDFVSLSDPKSAVILELKGANCTMSGLEKTLNSQVMEYAASEKEFHKGIIIASNGFEYCARYLYAPSRGKMLKTGKSFCGTMSSDLTIEKFVSDILRPTCSAIDRNIAEQYTVTSHLTCFRLNCANTQKQAWRHLIEGLSTASNRRTNGTTIDLLKELARDLSNFGQFRNIDDGKRIYNCWNKKIFRDHHLKFIKSTYGEDFPAELAFKNVLKEFRELLKNTDKF